MKHGSTTTHLKTSESRPKRPKTQQSVGKVMASVFWDAHGILFIDYLEKGKTINSDHYMSLLDRLSAKIKKERPDMQKKKVLFQQGNAPCHKSMKTMVKLSELSFELLHSSVCYQQAVAPLSLPMFFLTCCNHSNHSVILF